MQKFFLLIVIPTLIITADVTYFLVTSNRSTQQEDTLPKALEKQPTPTPLVESSRQNVYPPIQEVMDDGTPYEDKQVAAASAWANNPELKQRIIAVEQLGAYTTPESESMLTTVLASDMDPEVRRIAAQSLAAFKKPMESTTASLLAALQDDDENVQISAFNTLSTYVTRFEYDAKPMKNLLSNLNAVAMSSYAKVSTKIAIRSFLDDQKPSRP
jgi:hypothetical protein